MARPRSNELARSGHTPLGEHARATNADIPHPEDGGPAGPVPAQHRPGHRPEVDQDKPTGAFAALFTETDTEANTDAEDGTRSGQVRATVAAGLRLGSGFAAAERPDIVERLSSLDNALAAFPAGAVELELSTKDRDRPGRATTLQCWVTGWPRLVATSSQQAVTGSLVEVRDDLRRQLDDATAQARNRKGRS